jgi:hypothetical protein
LETAGETAGVSWAFIAILEGFLPSTEPNDKEIRH